MKYSLSNFNPRYKRMLFPALQIIIALMCLVAMYMFRSHPLYLILLALF